MNRHLFAAVAALSLLAGAASHTFAVDVEDLKPGLVAIYRDGAKPPVEIVRLEPTVALNWKANETAHPRLAAEGGSVEWQGHVNVLRAGTYRLSATLRGKLQVSVGGKDVLSVESAGDVASLETGPETRLEAGVHPIVAKFTRPTGAARVELLWQSPQFRAEPVPFDALFHLPAKVPAGLATDHVLERGRFLTEARNCTGCHKPDGADKVAKGLVGRQGPDLSQVGGRVYAGWLYSWLNDPRKVRPSAVMPKVFSDDAAGKTEAYAVARFLSSLGGPPKVNPKPPNPNEVRTSAALGKRLFTSVGCIACHNEEKGKQAANSAAAFYGIRTGTGWQNFQLGGLGSKTTPEALAAYLSNPHATDPSGTMPSLNLEGKEANDLARFLCAAKDQDISEELPAAPANDALLAAFKRVESNEQELTAFQKLEADKQLLDLGKRLVIAKNCAGCHTIAPDKKPLAVQPIKTSFADLKAEKSHAAGCLAEDAAKRGQAPYFGFKETDVKAVRQFLKEGSTGAGSPAPTYAARLTIQRFNCLACHQRDGEGGLGTDVVELLRQYEKADNAEAVIPPPLTGVGHKLRTPWLKQVLTAKGRARPWMGLRMPQFGDSHVGTLAEAFALVEGIEADDKVHAVPLNAAKIEAGKQLVGKGGFGCISCHDIAGIPNVGTRGPDLAGMNQRVRFDWYGRWLSEAQRMQPGTRMPTVFPEGKSTVETVLNGKANAQADAIWAYLSLGSGLPLPEGLQPPKGLILTVKDKPILLRTFMPDSGSRSVAIGFPGNVSTSFDANACRLSYAWSGNFLDTAPVWSGRGGNPAKLLGPKFWNAPQGCPWAVNDSNDPPDFAAQAKDLGYGAPLPDNKVYDGPRHLAFDGYTLDKDGVPTFKYRLDASADNPVKVSERPEPLKSPVALGVGRRFALHVPASRKAWLLAGETNQVPRLLDGKGNPLDLDVKAGRVELPTGDRLVVLPQSEGRVVVLEAKTAPEGTRWLLQKQGATWQLMLHLPAPQKATDMQIGINVWSPFRDEPALLKELLTAK